MLKFLKSIFILLLLIGIMLTFINIHVLVLEDVKGSNTIFIRKIYPNDEFTMKWMHSVELQPWEEIFKIDNNYNIILDRTKFKSFGAGVPDYAGNKTQIKDGYVIFSGINRKIDNLLYGVSNFAKHTFYFQDKELKLYKLVENDNPIKIYIDQVNILAYIIKKLLLN